MNLAYLALAFGLLCSAVASAEPRRRKAKGPVAINQEHNISHTALNKTSVERTGKVFSLFNVIKFKNSACTSTSTLSGTGTGNTNRRNGACFTQSQCMDMGGTVAGNCAAGFGVCCVFLIENSGSTVTQNCSYIRNPGFPTVLADLTADLTYTVNKCDASVCSLRLDFESFTVAGTGNNVEADAAAGTTGGVCLDSLTVTAITGVNYPVICGQNTGQHIYIDIGRLSGDTATLAFAFDENVATPNRVWEIKVTQIPCSNYNPPNGCLQYHTGLTGRFTTFNFLDENDNHLANHDYSVCIRQEAGFCCVQYSVCTDNANSMSLASKSGAAGANAGVGQQDANCPLDYIRIADSQAVCDTTSQPLHSKYCGLFLTNVDSGTANIPICDCTPPFQVDVFTDGDTDTGDAIANDPVANGAPSRGTCLTWTQIPCN